MFTADCVAITGSPAKQQNTAGLSMLWHLTRLMNLACGGTSDQRPHVGTDAVQPHPHPHDKGCQRRDVSFWEAPVRRRAHRFVDTQYGTYVRSLYEMWLLRTGVCNAKCYSNKTSSNRVVRATHKLQSSLSCCVHAAEDDLCKQSARRPQAAVPVHRV